ncbi:unnamed protein product [Protopolystoma xenopodis]|uniref:Uncharacterized protein n=1 Tax=Protopolystoma xenopodis TaxID=117903 RepID=A0A3S5A223_9PLAT|nr:unnamed protein product [Protopolystoma xenopodis]
MFGGEIRTLIPPADDGGCLLTSCRFALQRIHADAVSEAISFGQEESAVVFWWNRPSNLFTKHFYSKWKRSPRKQHQQESSRKANLQLVKRNPPSSSGGIDLGNFSPNPFTRKGSGLNKYGFSLKPAFGDALTSAGFNSSPTCLSVARAKCT